MAESDDSAGTADDSSSVPATPGKNDYTDGRTLGEWESKYPTPARRCINQEAFFLAGLLIVLCCVSGLLLALSGQTVDMPLNSVAENASAKQNILHFDLKILTIFFVGCVGGTTFSIKWLIHSVAKLKWHLDRRYWRMFVPLIGGVYACVVLTLFDGGVIGVADGAHSRSMATTAALAFLVGYFSDGVSGLLSNIANAVFGTLEKK
ncbi:hypothetical protein EPK99_08195 [Neorhizobium lilium]|uniref:Uncharacterized protein n=1 Tax=Neorhizobium lilium TaxID=2503024 RepID=A0A3S4UQ75_9HYPH|nr:hypothetical protein [Neorhizobium lilium]RWX78576.1 hypothetical protein EPK99_08195 [Neorhizobium lilium]